MKRSKLKGFMHAFLFGAVLSSSVINAEIKQDIYTSKNGSLSCSLPVFDIAEEINDFTDRADGYLAFQFEGDGFYSRTKQKTKPLLPGQTKEEESLENELLKIERKQEKLHFNLYDIQETKKEFLLIDGLKYRLYIANTGFDGKITKATGQLYTIIDNELVFYRITRWQKTSEIELKAAMLNFRVKCFK